MQRRHFLLGAGATGVLWNLPAQADAVPLSTRLMATLDIRCRDDVESRGLTALEVLEQVQAAPTSLQRTAAMQAVSQRALLWFGQAARALRARLVPLRDGGPVDPVSLEAALSALSPSEGSLARQQGCETVRRKLRPGQQARFARRLIARIDHAEQRARQLADRGEAPDVGWLLERPEAQAGKDVLKTILAVILIVALAILLVIGLVLLIGGIVLVIGAMSGNPALIAIGFAIVVAGLVAFLLLIFDQAPERAERIDSTRLRLAPRSP